MAVETITMEVAGQGPHSLTIQGQRISLWEQRRHPVRRRVVHLGG